MSRQVAALLIAVPLALAGCSRESGPTHVDPNAFAWSGSVPAGNWIHIRNIIGRISVVASDSATVDVRASRKWRGRDKGNVRFAQRETNDGIIICTIHGEHDSCASDSQGEDRDVTIVNPFDFFGGGDESSVEYVVRVPPGVKVDVSTISGEIGVAEVTGEVKAEAVNGTVEVASHGGPVTASTVNGSVRIAIDSLGAPGDIEGSTVNGSVTAQLPASLQANVSLETVTGSVNTDFAVARSDTSSTKSVNGVIGAGGRRVSLETVNGTVTLRKGNVTTADAVSP